MLWTREIDGFTVTATTEYDDCGDKPWERSDGHGIVSDWTTRDKELGERVLSSDRHSKCYYDFAGSMKIA